MHDPSGQDAGPKPRILLADDDELFCQGLQVALANQDYDITAVSSAEAALKALDSGPFDLLISDIHMPGNHNLELLKTLQQRTLVPVILMTGYPDVKTAVAAMKLAVVDYLTKPLSLVELRASIARGLAWGGAVRQLRSAQDELTEWLSLLGNVREAIQMTPALTQLTPPSAGAADLFERLSDDERENLTPREIEILHAFAGGQRIQEISGSLSVSVHTVRNHFRSIFSKLNVNSQVELLLKLFGSFSQEDGER